MNMLLRCEYDQRIGEIISYNNNALALSQLVGKYICKGLSSKFVKVKLLTHFIKWMLVNRNCGKSILHTAFVLIHLLWHSCCSDENMSGRMVQIGKFKYFWRQLGAKWENLARPIYGRDYYAIIYIQNLLHFYRNFQCT